MEQLDKFPSPKKRAEMRDEEARKSKGKISAKPSRTMIDIIEKRQAAYDSIRTSRQQARNVIVSGGAEMKNAMLKDPKIMINTLASVSSTETMGQEVSRGDRRGPKSRGSSKADLNQLNT